MRPRMSGDVRTHTPAQKSFTNFTPYPFVAQKGHTKWLGHGHGYNGTARRRSRAPPPEGSSPARAGPSNSRPAAGAEEKSSRVVRRGRGSQKKGTQTPAAGCCADCQMVWRSGWATPSEHPGGISVPGVSAPVLTLARVRNAGDRTGAGGDHTGAVQTHKSTGANVGCDIHTHAPAKKDL